MKQMIITMLIAGMASFSAQAQQKAYCGVKKNKVCRTSPDHKTVSCYKTNYAYNFKVCKSNSGYYICCETPNYYNSTHPEYVVAEQRQAVREYDYPAQTTTTPVNRVDMTAPQTQSYTTDNGRSYEGYYPTRGRIKVCYTGNNVAELNRAPYKGCPSPQYDGPEKNKQRNVNVSNPEPMPPLAGRAME